jgi:SNF2 family DNA or RNA helicase
VTATRPIEEAIALSTTPHSKSTEQSLNVSSKLAKLLQCLHAEPDHKAIIISQWREFLHLIGMALNAEKIKFTQLDGSIKPEARAELVEEFQNDESIRVCLLSLHAAAEGITLTAADRVYHMDPCTLLS